LQPNTQLLPRPTVVYDKNGILCLGVKFCRQWKTVGLNNQSAALCQACVNVLNKMSHWTSWKVPLDEVQHCISDISSWCWLHLHVA